MANPITVREIEVARELNSDLNGGLSDEKAGINGIKYGKNEMTKRKKKSFFKRLFEALTEPTLVILEFAFMITVGVNIGKYVQTGNGDIYECIGIFIAIMLSAFLTLYMEGRSEKAFEILGNVYDKISVKVVRNGEIRIISKESVVVGDVIILNTGDKIIADGRLIESNNLTTDESMLTGESKQVRKRADVILSENTVLAERINMVYSGTFVSTGTGKMIVTAVGDNAELGKIASDLQTEDKVSAPLNEKLTKLGQKITIIGGVSSAFVFVLSLVRLILTENVNFFTVEDAFLEAIVLIVAAVPEGLPTTAAISLSLNVLKLAKSNALIRKLVAAETVGCVSIICSDKTGTLTENKMKVEKLYSFNKKAERDIYLNMAVNSTAEIKDNGEIFGSATEGACLRKIYDLGYDYKKMRDKQLIGRVIPFNSDIKYMATEYMKSGIMTIYLKGAPEIVIKRCNLDYGINKSLLSDITVYQNAGKRVIAFAHGEVKERLENIDGEIDGGLIFDGYAVISDPIRKEVFGSVKNCKLAGIDVMIMTGDNKATATSIAYDLGIVNSVSEIVTASEIDKYSVKELSMLIKKIKVIARSTPSTKLKVVEALKSIGEVVAVTGDGVNDAPAIKKADIGIAMGSGSEITKEASDIVLLDDSFSTIVKAIAFGRNIYRNFQRFITFQLTVNLTAMMVVIVSLILGLKNPFNAVQLLWIDIIMDGPPALTLGLESGGGEYMTAKPVKRTDSIVTTTMLLRIIIHALIMSIVIILEYLYDFLGAGVEGKSTCIFCLFVIFQLMNAFNCRKIGSESIFKDISKNKLMIIVFSVTFVFQIILSQLLCGFFDTIPLKVEVWCKLILTAGGIVIISEIYKFFYRCYKKGQKNCGLNAKKIIKREIKHTL